MAEPTWKGKSEDVAITAAGTSDLLATIRIREGVSYLNVGIENAAHKALDSFWIQTSVHADAAYQTVASAASDYLIDTRVSDYAFPLLGASGDLTSLALSTSGWLSMMVKGLYGVKFRASSASGSDTTVSVYWQQR